MSEPGTGLSVRTTTSAEGVVDVVVVGEIDSATCGEIEQVLVSLASRATASVNLDLRDVSFIDSSGLRALLVGQRAIEAAGGVLRASAVSDTVRRLFEVTVLSERFGL